MLESGQTDVFTQNVSKTPAEHERNFHSVGGFNVTADQREFISKSVVIAAVRTEREASDVNDGFCLVTSSAA